jgi:tryptophanyl-tRNA synthetase
MLSKRILTGHRPTGPRHIGHLVGTLENWVKLQHTHECFFLVADLHVLTTDHSHQEVLHNRILDLIADWLATGIDPSRSTIILQSIIPEHAQLSLLFSMLTTIARLERVPTFKEQIKQLGLRPSLGLLTYPVLQAADILLYKAQEVPVGEDQLPHIEFTREIARRFNQSYGETFSEPRALLSQTPRLPGIDNRTMHTSYGNAIFLNDTPEETSQKVMSMFTDPARIHSTDPGQVVGNPLFDYLRIFSPDKGEVDEYEKRYRVGKIGDVELKKRLVEVLNGYLKPMRELRAEYISQPKFLLEVLFSGTVKAKFIAQQTLEEVHEKMGLFHSQSFSERVLSNNISGIF